MVSASCAKPGARALQSLAETDKAQRERRAGQLFDAIDSDNTGQVRRLLARDGELGTPPPYTGPMYTFEQVLEHLRKYDTTR